MTYKELDIKSDVIANKLINDKLTKDDLIAVKIKPSFEMIIIILGILKAGCAFLPVDLDYPKEWQDYVLTNSNAKFIITKDTYKDISLETLILQAENITISDDSLAYVIYTSGSTGKPKGVMIEHRNVLAYIEAFQNEFNITESDVVLQQASYSFDTFIEEVFPALTCGASIVLSNKDDVRNINRLKKLIERNSVTVISCSPLLLNELNKLKPFITVRLFISGGDVLIYKNISNLVQYADVYNTYGPTEATICACYFKCPKVELDKIPIGKPILGYEVFIMDGDLKLENGVVGEVCIAGKGVARGYLNNSQLSSERFIKDPLEQGKRIYRTGDLGKRLDNGNIEFVGRLDNQVKIRGYRIELEDIELHLMSNNKINKAVVVVKEGKENTKYLCAYYVSQQKLKPSETRKFLASRLPGYMIPDYFIELESLPITPNEKVDKDALPDPVPLLKFQLGQKIKSKRKQSEPNDIEEKIRAIVSENMDIPIPAEKVALNKNIKEIGIHSIAFIRILVAIENELGLTFDDEGLNIDNYSTLKDLLAYVSSRLVGDVCNG